MALTFLEKVGARFFIPKLKADREVLKVEPDESQKANHVDHSLWDKCMRQYISKVTIDGIEINGLDYKGLAVDDRFKKYLKVLSDVQIDQLRPNEMLALYINAYNALCADIIVKEYEKKGELPSSINNISKVFAKPAGTVGGETVSLDDIEHKKLRQLWSEPRIHACIVCAGVSCPNLRAEAFDARRINEQMDEQVTEWMSNPKKGLYFDASTSELYLSRIFLWFQSDFVAASSTKKVIDWIKPFLTKELEAGLGQAKKLRTSYLKYNWSLNNSTQ